MTSNTREDEFILKEYDSALKLTFRVDKLRSRLTGFFLTISGAALAGISLLLQECATEETFVQTYTLVGVFLLVISFLGMLFVGVVARLRRVQLEHFRIVNNIRSFFLGKNLSLWNLVELSSKTLPSPSRKSGTYLWTLTLFIVNSTFVSVSSNLLLVRVQNISFPQSDLLIPIISYIVILLFQDRLYFSLAAPPAARLYSERNPPWEF